MDFLKKQQFFKYVECVNKPIGEASYGRGATS